MSGRVTSCVSIWGYYKVAQGPVAWAVAQSGVIKVDLEVQSKGGLLQS